MLFVALSYQSATPAGYHPPLTWSPLFQRKRAFVGHHPLPSFHAINPRACTAPSLLPCGRRGTACGGGWRTRLLIRVPCTLAPILALPRQSIAHYVPVSCQSARPAGYHPPLPWSPLFHRKRAFVVHHPLPSFICKSLRGCTTPSLLPCGRRGTATAVEDRELAFSLEYLAYECSSLHYLTNQPPPPAITHH